MANWLKPLITDLYTQVLDWLKDRDTDLAKGLDPAAVTVENPQAGFIRYSSANRRWEKFDGTSWAPLATSYAISADTASKWATPRTLTLGGGATGSVSIDGAGNVTLTAAITQGPGSGLNADLLDNQQGAWYADIPARLGFTPVQQGTGVGQTANPIKIGWSSGGKLKVTVDSSDLGNIALESWATSYVASAISGKADTSGTYSGLNVGYAASAGNADTVDGWHRDDIRWWPNLSGKPAGADIPFHWSGQPGQPAWLWGANDSGNTYVWNPANFSVAYATTAGTASSATTAGSASVADGLSGASGSAPQYPCRAWVVFDGTGANGTNMTIFEGKNVASVYKVASGDYRITFTTALPSAHYGVSVIALRPSGNIPYASLRGEYPTSTTCRVGIGQEGAPTGANFDRVSVSVFH